MYVVVDLLITKNLALHFIVICVQPEIELTWSIDSLGGVHKIGVWYFQRALENIFCVSFKRSVWDDNKEDFLPGLVGVLGYSLLHASDRTPEKKTLSMRLFVRDYSV